jgi:fucose 4-O-acetylase-like acetyltransferase
MGARKIEYDIMKGLLIILVVTGHAMPGTLTKEVISWFHMPAFFMVSGLFLKQPDGNPLLDKPFYYKILHRYFVPMCVWLCLTYVFSFIHSMCTADSFDIHSQIRQFGWMLGPYWFIRALIVAHVVVSWQKWVDGRCSSRYNVCSLVACVLCWLLIHNPWIDFNHRLLQLFGAIFFVGIAKIWSQGIQHLSLRVVSVVFVIGFIIWNELYGFLFRLNMSDGVYDNWLLDLCVTLSFSSAIYLISLFFQWLGEQRLLSYVGKASMAIFYVHVPILFLTYGWPQPVRILLGVAVGTLVYALLQSTCLPGKRWRERLSVYLLGR